MNEKTNYVKLRNPEDKLEWYLSEKQIKKVNKEIKNMEFWTDSILSEAKKLISPNLQIELLSNGRFDLMDRNPDISCGYLNEKSLRDLLNKLDFAIQMVKLSNKGDPIN